MKTNECISIIIIIIIIVIVIFICIITFNNYYNNCRNNNCRNNNCKKNNFKNKNNFKACEGQQLDITENPYGLASTSVNDPNICCHSGLNSFDSCNQICNNHVSINVQPKDIHTISGQCCEYGVTENYKKCKYCGVRNLCVQWSTKYTDEMVGKGQRTNLYTYPKNSENNIMFKAPGGTFQYGKGQKSCSKDKTTGWGGFVSTCGSFNGIKIAGPQTCSKSAVQNYCNTGQYMKYTLGEKLPATKDGKFPAGSVNNPNNNYMYIWNGNNYSIPT